MEKKLEEATVVFCDVVGFSTRTDTKQFQLIDSLNTKVSQLLDKHLFYKGHSPNLLYLPTGDGMAAVFIEPSEYLPFSLLDDLVEWIKEESKKERGAKLRIGIHHGTINLITVNRYPNVCGATINICQRVMDAAHPNQVLISEEAFEEHHEIIREKYDYSPSPLQIIAKHNLELGVRILSQKSNNILAIDEPYPHGFIEGKEGRTGFLVKRIQKINEEIEKMSEEELEGIHIYEQAAFSTFWISPKAIDAQKDKNMTEEYKRLLVQQQKALNKLVEKAGGFKMILDPEGRKYPAKAMVERYKALLKWMGNQESNSKIDWVEGTSKSPNSLIISPRFCLEGYKLAHTAGYDLSLIHFDGKKLEEMIKSFNRDFDEAKKDKKNKSKQDVIDRFTRYMEKWKGKIPGHQTFKRKKR